MSNNSSFVRKRYRVIRKAKRVNTVIAIELKINPTPIIIKKIPKCVGDRTNLYGPFEKSSAQIPSTVQILFTANLCAVLCAQNITTVPMIRRIKPVSCKNGIVSRIGQKRSRNRPNKKLMKKTI